VFVILNFVSVLVVALNHENVAKSFWGMLIKELSCNFAADSFL